MFGDRRWLLTSAGPKEDIFFPGSPYRRLAASLPEWLLVDVFEVMDSLQVGLSYRGGLPGSEDEPFWEWLQEEEDPVIRALVYMLGSLSMFLQRHVVDAEQMLNFWLQCLDEEGQMAYTVMANRGDFAD